MTWVISCVNQEVYSEYGEDPHIIIDHEIAASKKEEEENLTKSSGTAKPELEGKQGRRRLKEVEKKNHRKKKRKAN